MQQSYDYIILGAGITGLSIANELKRRKSDINILILEKEQALGMHGSGRNSGVLHSGIYYPEASLKAKVCAEGARRMADYCKDRKLPINRIGKVIVPADKKDDSQLDILYQRARSNGANVEIIDQSALCKIEPFAYSSSGRALFVPDTAVVDPKAVLHSLYDELKKQGVIVRMASPCVDVFPKASRLKTETNEYQYGYLINATGQFSDRIAGKFGVGSRYTQLPFKGIYYKLAEYSSVRLTRLIYPVPDLGVPFLGVHSVNTIDGRTYFGPTAIPALGRENYYGMRGVQASDAVKIAYYLSRQYLNNQQGFRNLVHQEVGRLTKAGFFAAIKQLIPQLSLNDLKASEKVGIRAQLLDTVTMQLVTDFIVEHQENTTHILNAISPAFTSAFSFAEYIVNQIINRKNYAVNR